MQNAVLILSQETKGRIAEESFLRHTYVQISLFIILFLALSCFALSLFLSLSFLLIHSLNPIQCIPLFLSFSLSLLLSFSFYPLLSFPLFSFTLSNQPDPTHFISLSLSFSLCFYFSLSKSFSLSLLFSHLLTQSIRLTSSISLSVFFLSLALSLSRPSPNPSSPRIRIVENVHLQHITHHD